MHLIKKNELNVGIVFLNYQIINYFEDINHC